MRKLKLAVAVAISAIAITTCLSACGAPAHEHKMREVAAVASTCEKEGTAAYYECTDCKKLFSDEAGTKETTLKDLKLPLAEHDFYEVHSQKNYNCHWYTCSVCEETSDEVEHVFTQVENKAATYTHDGYTAGKVCLECGYGKEGGSVIPKTTLFTQETYEGVNYCLYEPHLAPTSTEKLPLVLFLSGSDERGDDNEIQLKNAICEVVKKDSDSKFMESVVLVPQCPENTMWADSPWADGAYNLADKTETQIMKDVMKLVKHYAELPYVDASRVYVIGISMGGIGAWDALARYPDVFAAGVPVCGSGPIDAVDTLKNIPIYTFHSSNDTSVPYSGTKTVVDAIKAAGGTKIEFVTFDKGHMIWDDAITYTGLEDWLFAKTK